MQFHIVSFQALYIITCDNTVGCWVGKFHCLMKFNQAKIALLVLDFAISTRKYEKRALNLGILNFILFLKNFWKFSNFYLNWKLSTS